MIIDQHTVRLLVLVWFWSCFFGAAQSQDTGSVEILHGPYLQHVTETGATIVFLTGKPAVAGVFVADEKGSVSMIRNSEDGLISAGELLHKIRITGLSPGNRYSYRIFANEILTFEPYEIIFGDTVRDEKIHSFTTPDMNKKEISFTVFNDIHSDPGKMGSYLAAQSVEQQDCYFLNGDLWNHVESGQMLFTGCLDTAIDRFASDIPFYFVRGNHETRGKYARDLKQYFDFPDDRYYYAFTRGPVHFVVLDSGEDKPDTSRYYYGLADFDAYRLEQLEWLKEHIKTDAFKNALFRIVLIHMPVMKTGNNWHGMEFLAEHFGPVLDSARIDLMVSGHLHRNQWLKSGESGFSYPVLICSNKDFVEVTASTSGIKIWLKNSHGEIMEEYLLSSCFDSSYGSRQDKKPSPVERAEIPFLAGESRTVIDTGPDTALNKNNWYTNDHCFVIDHEGTLHWFGINNPYPPEGKRLYRYHPYLGHAVTDNPTGVWERMPFALDESHGTEYLGAPFVIWHDESQKWVMVLQTRFGERYGLEVCWSDDLYQWKRTRIPILEDVLWSSTRDPHIMKGADGKYWIHVVSSGINQADNAQIIRLKTKDFHDFEKPEVIMEIQGVRTAIESPFLMERNGLWYLFCTYAHRRYEETVVIVSDDPGNFDLEKNCLTTLFGHAAEIFTYEGRTYISSCGPEDQQMLNTHGITLAGMMWAKRNVN